MHERARELIDRFYDAMASGDLVGLAELYAADALMIRFDGTSEGADAIVTFLSNVGHRHRSYMLESIEHVTQAGDVVMWDAMVKTADGLLQTTDVVVLNADGKITRHIPGVRGYWGL